MRLSFTSAGLNAELSTVCRHCLRQEPTGEKLIWLGNELFPEPLTARCEGCVVRNRLLTPGDRVYMKTSLDGTYICWWCGWPTGQDQEFHAKCCRKYCRVCLIHYVLYLIRNALLIATFEEAMQHFASEAIVCGPAIVSIFSANKYSAGQVSEGRRNGVSMNNG